MKINTKKNAQGIKFTVIIPTRERVATLGATLKSCIEQDYDNYKIIVSDNFSTDNTQMVVKSFNDDRILYLNTGKRIAMHENWEFALSHVHDGYVTVIGDDDALMPNAVNDLCRMIQTTNALAISWIKAEYCWPNHPILELRNQLILPIVNRMIRFKKKDVARDVQRFIFPYNRTPTLYNSAVNIEELNKARAIDGLFFKSISPDIYSGIALLSRLDSYLLSTRPFSVNGASAASNGTAFASQSSEAEPYLIFLKELSSYHDHLFGRVRGSVFTEVVEAIMQANKHVFEGKFRVSKMASILRIVAELSKRGGRPYKEGMTDLSHIASANKLRLWFNFCRAICPSNNVLSSIQVIADKKNFISFNVSNLGGHDVFEAADIAGKIIGNYVMPESLEEYSFGKLITSKLCQRFKSIKNIDTFSTL